ncbi:hypothetical protein ABH37_00795 [Mycobacterium haemophilum]|uniref:Uncharacterized protein n=1 Tax=Mycobacterium haemophilum TaxID=29311 RepID=A0A0I9UBX9_9MYCO|nr:hypothetical protein ABH39_00790 [Mycobacterium haemophilum]KLO38948.1 hypothetical protein ABH38_00790 [Mycobacterium haemophilum]KLO45366.1 hypothetical protein ABH37_00795 [Mycobacterium haemophilum]KLO56515.1 hypothetical protein ABH36_00790 [Mycobacterium haemophilum]
MILGGGRWPSLLTNDEVIVSVLLALRSTDSAKACSRRCAAAATRAAEGMDRINNPATLSQRAGRADLVPHQGLVTFTMTGSPGCTTVPAGGSMLTTVQFAAWMTKVYLGFAEVNFTSVKPRLSSFFLAISAF